MIFQLNIFKKRFFILVGIYLLVRKELMDDLNKNKTDKM